MAHKKLPKVISEKVFRATVEKLRKKEKQNTREQDSAERRRLSMMEMKNDYVSSEGRFVLRGLIQGGLSHSAK